MVFPLLRQFAGVMEPGDFRMQISDVKAQYLPVMNAARQSAIYNLQS
jgi:hypothetical protein